jgi:hypothetical protein
LLHKAILAQADSLAAQDGTTLLLPLSIYTHACPSLSLSVIAQEVCSLVVQLTWALPPSRLAKVLVVVDTPALLRDALQAFTAHMGPTPAWVVSDVLGLSRSLRTDFAASAFRSDLELQVYVENLEVRPHRVLSTATALQVRLGRSPPRKGRGRARRLAARQR